MRLLIQAGADMDRRDSKSFDFPVRVGAERGGGGGFMLEAKAAIDGVYFSRWRGVQTASNGALGCLVLVLQAKGQIDSFSESC